MDGSNWSSSSTGEKNAAQMMMLAIHPSVGGVIWRSITEGPERGTSVGSANTGACTTSIICRQQIFTNDKRCKIPMGLSGEAGWLSPSLAPPRRWWLWPGCPPSSQGTGTGFGKDLFWGGFSATEQTGGHCSPAAKRSPPSAPGWGAEWEGPWEGRGGHSPSLPGTQPASPLCQGCF